MTLYRLNVKPGKSANHEDSFAYCKENDVLGVGWGMNAVLDHKHDWQSYWNHATSGGNKQSKPYAVRRLKNTRPGSLIWTRTPGGRGDYYLARVTGEWEYRDAHLNQKLDIYNVLPCRIHKVDSITAVPGAVEAAFFRGSAYQRIADPDQNLETYSQYLWNDLDAKHPDPLPFDVPNELQGSLWRYLNAEQLEDVVFIYLQSQGWWAIPSSRQRNKPGFEYAFVHSRTGQTAKVQVKAEKHGPVNFGAYDDTDLIYLFHAARKGYEPGSPGYNKAIHLIEPKAVEAFLRQHRQQMPKPIRFWLDRIPPSGA